MDIKFTFCTSKQVNFSLPVLFSKSLKWYILRNYQVSDDKSDLNLFKAYEKSKPKNTYLPVSGKPRFTNLPIFGKPKFNFSKFYY